MNVPFSAALIVLEGFIRKAQPPPDFIFLHTEQVVTGVHFSGATTLSITTPSLTNQLRHSVLSVSVLTVVVFIVTLSVVAATLKHKKLLQNRPV